MYMIYHRVRFSSTSIAQIVQVFFQAWSRGNDGGMHSLRIRFCHVPLSELVVRHTLSDEPLMHARLLPTILLRFILVP